MRRAMVAVALVAGLGMPLAACGSHAEQAVTESQYQLADVVGTYGCGRATIEVEADSANGENAAKMHVFWGSSAWEQSVWEMSGTFDPATLTIRYENAVYTEITYSDEGVVDKEDVKYTDGTGSLTFENVDGTWHLTWDDEHDHVADEMDFTS